ncbi:hypothetical protein D3C71_1165870 [compost metagenome]
MQVCAAQMRRVIQHADRFIVTGTAQVLDQRLGRLTGAQHQYPACSRVGLDVLIVLPCPVQQTRGTQQC